MGEGIYMYRRSEAAKRAIELEFNQRLNSSSYVRQHSYLSPRGGYVLFLQVATPPDNRGWQDVLQPRLLRNGSCDLNGIEHSRYK